MTISPSLITARSPPANGSSIGESARRPAFEGRIGPSGEFTSGTHTHGSQTLGATPPLLARGDEL
jgi:hypothetical protein